MGEMKYSNAQNRRSVLFYHQAYLLIVLLIITVSLSLLFSEDDARE